jgi:hypothetical protein
MTKTQTTTKIEALSDAELDSVAGGLNPQPLPPHELFVLSHFIMPKINFSHLALPSLNNFFRF